MVRIASENSTSVRARIAAAVTAARLVAPALPGVAIGLALHVFTSPRRHEAPARERELEAKGESLRPAAAASPRAASARERRSC